MKTLDIALKDLLRSFRSVFILVFAFVLPLLTVAIFYFAFGGGGGDEGGFDLPTTEVQVVNLDDGWAGQALVDVLQNQVLTETLQVTIADDAESARAAVDNQEAGVAVIIPAGFTAAAEDPEGHAAVVLYQDPALTIGPRIVKGVVSQVVDGFAGYIIAGHVAEEQLDELGVPAGGSTLDGVRSGYVAWVQALGQRQGAGTNPLFDAQPPPGAKEEPTGHLTQILNVIMAAMLVFYVFFTGASATQSILKEEEEGTLPRLFTTPTPLSAILGGKFIAVFATLVVQVTVLIALSVLIFGAEWGDPPAMALVTLGLIVLAASFGIFVTSFLKSTKQAGFVYGGVMSVVGWIGISRMFTALLPGPEEPFSAVNTVSLLSPHGWALRGWQEVMAGAGASDVLLTVAVMVALSVVFFSIGLLKFRKRFA